MPAVPAVPSGASSQHLLLAMLADARLPSGAHTQSGGLEPALRAGLDPATVPAYIAARLRTVTAVEAATAVVARHVSLAGGDLGVVERAWAARTPSGAARASSRQLGRGYLRLVDRLWPDGSTTDRSWRPSRAVALGVLAARAGLDAENVVRLVAYDDVQAVASACLKLAPVDPMTTTRWVLDAHPLVEDLVGRLAAATTTDHVPASGAPLVEHWAETHARTTERLFSA